MEDEKETREDWCKCSNVGHAVKASMEIVDYKVSRYETLKHLESRWMCVECRKLLDVEGS